MNSNYNYKSRARSDSIKCNNNMPDLVDSYIIHRKLDPGLLLCCSYNTSAESSTSSQMQYLEPIKNQTIHFKLQKPDQPISASSVISVKKKGANCDLNRKANCFSSNYIDGTKKGIMEEEGVVCSMCGDEGIAELLFLCSKCSYRPQHIYCSRSYPDLCGEASICNWCLHEEDSLASRVAKASGALNETNARKVNNANVRRGNANVIVRPIKVLNCPADHVHEASKDEYKDEVLVKKGAHGKAFEYLLLIAAQSLRQVISEANAEIKQVNHTASMLNITNPKMGSLDNRSNSDLDKKIDMGSIDNKANTSTFDNQAGLSMGLDSKQSILEDKMDVGVGVFRGNIPKRQRCSKGINTSLKCRKKGLQLSPSRPNYRRYKLLADVVC